MKELPRIELIIILIVAYFTVISAVLLNNMGDACTWYWTLDNWGIWNQEVWEDCAMIMDWKK